MQGAPELGEFLETVGNTGADRVDHSSQFRLAAATVGIDVGSVPAPDPVVGLGRCRRTPASGPQGRCHSRRRPPGGCGPTGSSTPMIRTESSRAVSAVSSPVVASTTMASTVSQGRPSSRAIAAIEVWSSINRRRMCRAQCRVVGPPERARRFDVVPEFFSLTRGVLASVARNAHRNWRGWPSTGRSVTVRTIVSRYRQGFHTAGIGRARRPGDRRTRP